MEAVAARSDRRADPAPTPAAPTPPLWLTAAEAVHGASPGVATFVFDALVAGSVAWTLFGVRRAATQAVTVVLLSCALFGVYRRRPPSRRCGVAWYAVRLVPCALALAGAEWGAPPVMRGATDGPMALVGAAVGGGALVGARALLWLAVAWRRSHGVGLVPALVVGSPAGVATVSGLLAARPRYGLSCAGVWAAEADDPPAGAGGRWRGPYPDPSGPAAGLATGAFAEVLVVAEGGDSGAETVLGAWFRLAASLPGEPPAGGSRGGGHPAPGRPAVSLVLARGRLLPDPARARLGPLALLAMDGAVPGPPAPVRRAVDLAAGLALSLALIPLAALAAAVVWLAERGPVLYRQPRVGSGGRAFPIVKLRSMRPGADAEVERLRHANAASGLLFKVRGDPRVGPVAAVIRRLALDEVPQLINVVRGDMGLVGPRPLPVEPSRFGPVASLRHIAPPGITGLWQVEGGNNLTYDEMVALDLAYLAGWSVGRDLWILARTPLAVLLRRGPA
ncbi:MAG TPA: sugar transferase [Acidimicrobiales bacterium]|nr:sugar transferase [Acidimicrobiales bacterium]